MKKIKYIKTKMYVASHPLYDAMQKICNPSGKDCGAFFIYKDIIFNMDSTSEQYFDEKGQLTKQVYVSHLNEPESNWLVSKTTYKDGKPIEVSGESRSEYIKDYRGNVIEYKYFGEDSKLFTHEKYRLTYDDKGRIYKKEYLNTSKAGDYETYEYDDRGRITVRCDYVKGGFLSWRFLNYYDSKGNLERDEEEFYGDEMEGFQDTPRYTLISAYTREYDDEGNCILEYLKCEDGLQPDELTIREIEYAE